MPLKTALGLAAALLLLSSAATAGDADGRYAIKGVGGQPCTDYNQKRKDQAPETYMYLGWFQGWMSNENRHAEETFDLASWQHTATLLAALDNYCRNNPEHPFVAATEALITAMRPGRLTAQTRLVTAETGERKVAVYAATLVRLQSALKQAGVFTGPADGTFGQQTEAAIRAYQKREKLPETGLPDQVILQRLVHRDR